MSRQQRRALAREQVKAVSNQQSSPAIIPVAPASAPPVGPKHGGGPNTPQGKAVSSRNALSHGLTSARLVLPWENQADFDELLDGLLQEHQPATITEQIMVKEMAEQYWRLIRARNQEHAYLSRTDEVLERAELDPDAFRAWEKTLQLTARYVTSHQRAFHKCLSTLRTLQKERRAKEAEAQAEAQTANETSQPHPESVSQNEPITPAAIATPSEFVSQTYEMPAATAMPPCANQLSARAA